MNIINKIKTKIIRAFIIIGVFFMALIGCGNIDHNPTPVPEPDWYGLRYKYLSNDYANVGWQLFTINGSNEKLDIVKAYFKTGINNGATAYCELWSAEKNAPLSTAVGPVTITSTTGEELIFDFTAQSLNIEDGKEYWLKFYGAVFGDFNIYPIASWIYRPEVEVNGRIFTDMELELDEAFNG